MRLIRRWILVFCRVDIQADQQFCRILHLSLAKTARRKWPGNSTTENTVSIRSRSEGSQGAVSQAPRSNQRGCLAEVGHEVREGVPCPGQGGCMA